MSTMCTVCLAEGDPGPEPVPPPQHRVLLHLLCGQGRTVAGHEAAQRR